MESAVAVLPDQAVGYPASVGKAEIDQGPDFADVLGASIARWYPSALAFAEAAGVAAASVSRWLRRQGVPTARIIEQIAPHILDAKGQPIPASRLMAVARPGLGPPSTRLIYVDRRPIHQLARDVDALLDEETPMPADERENLMSLIDAVVRPYRRYLRKRKVG